MLGTTLSIIETNAADLLGETSEYCIHDFSDLKKRALWYFPGFITI
jgi:hypothetical protein